VSPSTPTNQVRGSTRKLTKLFRLGPKLVRKPSKDYGLCSSDEKCYKCTGAE